MLTGPDKGSVLDFIQGAKQREKRALRRGHARKSKIIFGFASQNIGGWQYIVALERKGFLNRLCAAKARGIDHGRP